MDSVKLLFALCYSLLFFVFSPLSLSLFASSSSTQQQIGPNALRSALLFFVGWFFSPLSPSPYHLCMYLSIRLSIVCVLGFLRRQKNKLKGFSWLIRGTQKENEFFCFSPFDSFSSSLTDEKRCESTSIGKCPCRLISNRSKPKKKTGKSD